MAQTKLDEVIGETSNERESEEVVSADDDRVSYQKGIAAAHHEMHNAYTANYESLMRIRFSWTIFYLIFVWLVTDIYLVVASGMGSINLRFFASAIGLILGGVLGSLWGHACRNARNIKDLKGLYNLPLTAREDKAARNMQLRVMRSEGSFPCFVSCVIVGSLIGYFFLSEFVGDTTSIPFKLEGTLLLTLICTTTASVLGLFIIVLHWLFPRRREEHNNTSPEGN